MSIITCINFVGSFKKSCAKKHAKIGTSLPDAIDACDWGGKVCDW